MNKRKLQAFYNRNKKYKKDFIFAFITGVILSIAGYIEYLDFIARGII